MVKEYAGCVVYIFLFFVLVIIGTVIKYPDSNNLFRAIAINLFLYPLFIIWCDILLVNIYAIIMLFFSLIFVSDLIDVFKEYVYHIIGIGAVVAYIFDIVLYKTIGFNLMEFMLDLLDRRLPSLLI